MSKENASGCLGFIFVVILFAILAIIGLVREHRSKSAVPRPVYDQRHGEEGAFESHVKKTFGVQGHFKSLNVVDSIAYLELRDGSVVKLTRTSPGVYKGGTFNDSYEATLDKDGKGYTVRKR